MLAASLRISISDSNRFPDAMPYETDVVAGGLRVTYPSTRYFGFWDRATILLCTSRRVIRGHMPVRRVTFARGGQFVG